ncbi:MAG TPA: hypothetical protein ENK16_03630 [Chromatiales bacterium]|nr:hypothetical protein [Chromatiales bacterium]
MRRKAPDSQFYAEIRELNQQFLDLIADPSACRHPGLLQGLPVGIAESVASLSAESRLFLADVPGLLVEFAWLSGPVPAADPGTGVADGAPDPDWLATAQVFVAGLMTYVWQLARRDPFASALCLGLSVEGGRMLATMSFTEVQRNARHAIPALRVRYGHHPRLWRELLRAARHLNPEQRDRCRADLISLGLADIRHHPDGWRLERAPCTMRRDVRAVTSETDQDLSQRGSGAAGYRS